MATIAGEVQLADKPILQTAPSGAVWTRVPAILHNRELDKATGQYVDVGKMSLQLKCFGATARHLVEAAAEGSIALVVIGDLKPRSYTRKDGTEGTSNDVEVASLGVSLRSHDVSVHRADRQAGTEMVEEDQA